MPNEELVLTPPVVERAAPRASESGHWYKRDGTPVYEIAGSAGKMVTPDIRHARKHNLVPGITTIVGCAAKPQLTTWLMKEAIKAALSEVPRRPHEPEVTYLDRIIDAANQKSKNAADEGTRIHAAVEQHYSGRDYSDHYLLHVESVIECLNKHFGADTEWVAEESFACHLGYGSKIDLRAKNKRIIVDVKGKDFTERPTGSTKFWYDEHAMQLGAYGMAQHIADDGPPHVCANLFVSRNAPGLVHLHIWDEEDIRRGWDMFSYLLAFWQAKSKYCSAWQP